jgi:phosphatidylglycerophosphate synthase
MFDATIRPWIDLTFNPLGRRLAQQGATADQVTIAGFALGLGSAFAIAAGQFKLSLTLIALNRVCDGLDGAIARATRPTDRGGFLDIVLDFVFYASVPLAFAFHDPAHNAVAAAALIAAFLANGGAFLAYAAAAAKRGITTTAQGSKSIYYMAGMAEGAETVLVFCAFCLWPEAFSWLAIAFAGMCALSAAGRLIIGWRTLAD